MATVRRSAVVLLQLAVAISLGTGRASGAEPSIETLYVVQMCHADVGFNAPPTVMQQRNHDRTVAALDLADAYPEFKWTIETVYQLEGFLDRAGPFDIARLTARLEEGRFAYGANYTNLHSGLTGEHEFNQLIMPALRFAERYDLPPAQTALLDDVPGFTAATPRVLESNDVQYALLGPNDFVGGKPDIPLEDRPFWWEGRDGSRVLTWMTWGSYIEGYFNWGLTSLANAERFIPMRLQEFEEAGYPFDALLVMRGSDDEFPDSTMPELAREWNAKHASPKIVLATAQEFFQHLLDKYGDVFPTYIGDAAGMWESAAMVTPATTARVRRARSILPDAEALWRTLADDFGMTYPTERFVKAWKRALVFDEHSGGGMGWPGLLTEAEIKQENREFRTLALRSQAVSENLLNEATEMLARKLVPAGEHSLLLFNPANAPFDGVVDVDCGSPQRADLRLVDRETGEPLIFRWTKADRSALAFRTQIPVNGSRRWRIARGGTTPHPPAWSSNSSITLGNLRLALDPIDGTVASLRDAAQGFEWIDQGGAHSFGGIEKGTNIEVFFGIWQPFSPRHVSIRAEGPSPVFRRMRVFDRAGGLLFEYRLFEHETRVDLLAILRRSRLPFVPYDDHSIHLSISFPANLARPTTLWLEGPDGTYQPGPESLPGTGLGHFASSTGARLEGPDGRWLSVSSVDSPMVDLGEMDEAPLSEIETDETALTWKLIRHASLSMVSGGALVPIVPEQGMPDATPYMFRIRFGDGSTLPPDSPAYFRDMAPPPAVWIAPALRR